MDEFRDSNAGVAYVTCPRVEHRYTTSRALMMEYIDGIPIDDTDRLREEGYDLGEIGEKLAENYVRQILDEAFFHADPHPGNLRIRAGKIVFLDLGMMGRLSEKDRELLKTAVRAVAQNDAGTLKDVLLTWVSTAAKSTMSCLYADIDEFLSRYASMGMADIDLARLMEELLGLANPTASRCPRGCPCSPGASSPSRGCWPGSVPISKSSPSCTTIWRAAPSAVRPGKGTEKRRLVSAGVGTEGARHPLPDVRPAQNHPSRGSSSCTSSPPARRIH